MLLFLLLACTGAPDETETGSLSGMVYDCALGCWSEGAIEVPVAYWDTWLDGTLCDDGGLLLAYDGECFQTREFCESAWADDPAVADASECCGGIDPEPLQAAPACTDLP